MPTEVYCLAQVHLNKVAYFVTLLSTFLLFFSIFGCLYFDLLSWLHNISSLPETSGCFAVLACQWRNLIYAKRFLFRVLYNHHLGSDSHIFSFLFIEKKNSPFLSRFIVMSIKKEENWAPTDNQNTSLHIILPIQRHRDNTFSFQAREQNTTRE